jgi:hypothetical protein
MSLIGRLEDLALSDIFQILSIGRKTGTLLMEGEKGKAFVVFKNGLIVRADTDIIDGNLGHDLLKNNLIKESILNLAMEVKKTLPEKPIAEILLELGSVTKDMLDRVTRKRIERVIYHLLLMNQGTFRFELDNLDLKDLIEIADTGWEVSKGLSPEYLLMEGARVYDEERQGEVREETPSEEQEEEGWGEDWSSTPVMTERRDISALKSLTQELRFPNSTSEITLLILRFASDIFQRGVLFMVGEDEMAGLGQFGLEIEGADEKIRETILHYITSPFFSDIIDSARTYKGPLERDGITEAMIREIGGNWPSEVAIFPVIAEGRVVALLYCDNASTGEAVGETEGLEIFISQAGLALEKSLLQRRLQDLQDRKKG